MVIHNFTVVYCALCHSNDVVYTTVQGLDCLHVLLSCGVTWVGRGWWRKGCVWWKCSNMCCSIYPHTVLYYHWPQLHLESWGVGLRASFLFWVCPSPHVCHLLLLLALSVHGFLFVQVVLAV